MCHELPQAPSPKPQAPSPKPQAPRIDSLTKTFFLSIFLCLASLPTAAKAQWVQTVPSGGDEYVQALAVSGSTVFAGTEPLIGNYGVVLVTTDNGTSWTVANNGLTNQIVNALAVSGSTVFAGMANGAYGNGGVYVTTDNGASWTASGFANQYVRAFAVSGSSVYAGLGGGGVQVTTDNGASWTAVNNGLSNAWVTALAVSGSTVFAGANGVWVSTNNGASWTATGLMNQTITALAVSGSTVYAGFGNNGVFVSTDNGASWTASNGLNYPCLIESFAVFGSTVFAATSDLSLNDVYFTTNNGASWTATGIVSSGCAFTALAVSGNYLFAGTSGYAVYRLDLTLTDIPLPVELLTFSAQQVSKNILFKWETASEVNNQGFCLDYSPSGKDWHEFASYLNDSRLKGHGTTPSGYKYSYFTPSISDSVRWYRLRSVDYGGKIHTFAGVQLTNSQAAIPTSYALSQNYPNPFNPSTLISYQLPVSSQITLRVYDVLGREVATLVNEKKAAGNYTASFDASKFASGVYFYKLQAGNFVQTKKMLLVK
jgi:hypothetical protein